MQPEMGSPIKVSIVTRMVNSKISYIPPILRIQESDRTSNEGILYHITTPGVDQYFPSVAEQGPFSTTLAGELTSIS